MIEHRGSYIRYRLHLVDRKGDQVRDEIETPSGTVARLILRDGRPLTEQENRDELSRLDDVLQSPEAFAKHVKEDRASKKIAIDIAALVPDAMLYTYVPGQPQLPGIARPQVVLDFKPNPAWNPPTTISEGLTGLMGRVWIDGESRTVTRLEGTIFRSVRFGFGMLANIYPGGKIAVEQVGVNDSRWIVSRFMEDVSLRALMVKRMDLRTSVETSGYQTVPAMSPAEAVQLLRATPLPQR